MGITTDTEVDVSAGYTPDGNITAITLLHESGTGGAPKACILPSTQSPIQVSDCGRE